MSFSINTNVASLNAQNYLRTSSDFQASTINKVTSGLRIVKSGDDAAGLAIANGYRSDEAVLTQGIRNANDGLSQLQIADGGINNISQLLDRARTLATQSATGTFTGDRGVLNSEFQSVLGEINRQAQSIGLNTNGSFAQKLSVFIGGGKGATTADVLSNGSVALDLSHSTVDTKSLGLTGVQAVGQAGTDIGPNSATSVARIIANNTGTQAGHTTFYVSGGGFSGSNKVAVNVNLTGVSDANTLVSAINSAIQQTGNGGTQYATAFANAGVSATTVTDANTNATRLAFTSGTSSFQVEAGDTLANALLGNFATAGQPQGASLTTTVTGGTTFTAPTLQNVVGSSLNAKLPITIDATNNSLSLTVGGTTAALTLTQQSYQSGGALATEINKQIAAGGLAGTATATVNASGQLVLQATSANNSVTVNATANNADSALGFTDNQTSSSVPAITVNDQVTLRFQGGGLDAPVDLQLSQFSAGSTTAASVLTDIQSKITGNSTLSAAGISVADTAGHLVFTQKSGQQFSVQATGDTTNVLGLGTYLPNGNNVDYQALTAVSNYSTTQSTANGTATIGISINGGADQSIQAALTSSAKTYGTNAITSGVTFANDGGAHNGHLNFKLNGTTVDVAGLTASKTQAQILTAINTAIQGQVGAKGVASVNGTGQLVITAGDAGSNSTVQIVGASSDTGVLSGLGLTNGTTTGVTTDATTASLTGTGVNNLPGVDLSADATATNQGKIALVVDGQAATVDLSAYAAGGGTPGTATGTQILTAFNTALAGIGTASYDTSGNLQIKSNTTGANSNVQILSAGSDATTIADLGLSVASNTGSNASTTSVLQQLNSAIAQNSTLSQAGIVASLNGNAIKLQSGDGTHGTNFRVNAYGSGDLGFGTLGSTYSANASVAAPNASPYFDAQGSTQTATLAFNPVVFGSDKQTLTFSGTDTAGNQQNVSVSLNSSNARSIDEALATVNGQLQQSNNPTLQQITAVKEDTNGTQGIKFISNLNSFSVSVGSVASGANGVNANTAGIVIPGASSTYSQGNTVSGAVPAGQTGSTADISNQTTAQTAVQALAGAISTLGRAQAVVGRGENQFTFAVNLAQSQLTNTQTAESRIRDADLASESANLTKAQILIQAGVAALAQANSAPQQVLSLLRG